MRVIHNLRNCFISRFLYDTSNKTYRKYRQRIDSLRKGMILESDARQRETEKKAIDEIAGTSESLADKGKTELADSI